MTIQTKNFYAYGLPTGIVANKGVVYTNVQDGKQYVQLTVPYGSNWVVNGLTNFFYYPTSGAVNSVTGSAPIQSSGGTNPNISIPKADATTDGYLSSADWNTFNAGSTGGVPTTRTIATTSPLQGGGDLSANRTLSIQQSSGTQNGYLSSTDWTTFNNKQNALGYTPVPTTRTLTIDGVSQDLSADRTWTTAGANGISPFLLMGG